MSTSQKHQNFVSEAMKDKPVTDIAGIGEVYGSRLAEKGFDKAYVLLGQYLLLKKDEDMFTDYLKENFQFNQKYAKNCFDCLNEWAEFNV